MSTPDSPISLNDASACQGEVTFIWDGHLITAPVTGHSLDCRGQLTVHATHPVTGRAEYKNLWRHDVIPVPPEPDESNAPDESDASILDRIDRLLTDAFALVRAELHLGERDQDLIDLVTSTALTRLDIPTATLDDVITEHYSATPRAVRGWWTSWSS